MEKLPNSKACFVCGDSNPAGVAARFRIEDDKVLTDCTLDERHMGYKGIAHGGVIAALLDETMGWAPAVANRRFCLTVEISVQYVKPVPIGLPVTISGWVTADRKRLWDAAGEIRDSAGTVYARGTGRYIAISDEQTRDVVRYLQFDEDCVPPERICRTCGNEAMKAET